VSHDSLPEPAPAGGAALPPEIGTGPALKAGAARGFAFAMAAYVLWGFLPLYMKAVAHISAFEVVAHRILWSLPVAGIIIYWLGQTAELRLALRNPRVLALAALTALLISINWSIYVWAISVDRTVETALGYYINPLLNVVMGAAFLGERFNRQQIVAVGLALVGVAILTRLEHRLQKYSVMSG
jgi:chloramphenicol-sensitive protein RarD